MRPNASVAQVGFTGPEPLLLVLLSCKKRDDPLEIAHSPSPNGS